MAHKQCVNKLDERCDCIKDDLIELQVIKNNIKNLKKLLKHFYLTEKGRPFFIKNLSNYLKLRLVIENELEEING